MNKPEIKFVIFSRYNGELRMTRIFSDQYTEDDLRKELKELALAGFTSIVTYKPCMMISATIPEIKTLS